MRKASPLCTGTGPLPVQLLCAAVGNCLSDSLLFAFRKFKQTPEPIHCEAQAVIGRNEQGRMRVLKMDAKLKLGVAANQLEHAERVLSQFEEFCTGHRVWARAYPYILACWTPTVSS